MRGRKEGIKGTSKGSNMPSIEFEGKRWECGTNNTEKRKSRTGNLRQRGEWEKYKPIEDAVPVSKCFLRCCCFSGSLERGSPGLRLSYNCSIDGHSVSCWLHVVTERLDTSPSCWASDHINPWGFPIHSMYIKCQRESGVDYKDCKPKASEFIPRYK